MKLYNIIIAICLVITVGVSSCTKDKPKLEGFNSELWKADKKGCNGKRIYLSEFLFTNSVNIKGMKDNDILELMGKPEKTNWEDRGKKTYYYFIQPGSQCDSTSLLLEGTKIAFEFDALGRVKLVTEQKY
jgi:hypothetical protein